MGRHFNRPSHLFDKLDETFDSGNLVFVADVSHINGVGKVCIGKREYGYICLINRIDPGNQGDSEIFGNQGSNCVFIRTLTDDVYLQLLFFIEVTGEATESGIAVIPDQRIVSKVTATDRILSGQEDVLLE